MVTNRLSVLAELAGQVKGGLALELALSEAWAQGEAAALHASGSVPAPGRPSSSSGPLPASTGSMLADLAGTLVQDYVRTNFPGVLPPAPPVEGSSTARKWCSDDPELVPALALALGVNGGQVTLEENEAMRLLSQLPVSACTVTGGSFTGHDIWWWGGAVTGYRLALELERLDVALVPGGSRG